MLTAHGAGRPAAGPEALPGLPRDDDGPVFGAPWQAQAFALAVALHERGAFAWTEFAAALADEIRRAPATGAASVGDQATHADLYYAQWLAALESLVLAKGMGDADRLHALEHAWADAAARTPHGQPIELTGAERATGRP